MDLIQLLQYKANTHNLSRGLPVVFKYNIKKEERKKNIYVYMNIYILFHFNCYNLWVLFVTTAT